MGLGQYDSLGEYCGLGTASEVFLYYYPSFVFSIYQNINNILPFNFHKTEDSDVGSQFGAVSVWGGVWIEYAPGPLTSSSSPWQHSDKQTSQTGWHGLGLIYWLHDTG